MLVEAPRIFWCARAARRTIITCTCSRPFTYNTYGLMSDGPYPNAHMNTQGRPAASASAAPFITSLQGRAVPAHDKGASMPCYSRSLPLNHVTLSFSPFSLSQRIHPFPRAILCFLPKNLVLKKKKVRTKELHKPIAICEGSHCVAISAFPHLSLASLKTLERIMSS